MDAFIVDPTTTRDISELLLDADGRLRVVPASALASTTAKERFMFGVRHGIYGLPTQELCDFLRERIAGRTAIEIGAGHDVLAQALGIPATDSRLQEQPETPPTTAPSANPPCGTEHTLRSLTRLQPLPSTGPRSSLAHGSRTWQIRSAQRAAAAPMALTKVSSSLRVTSTSALATSRCTSTSRSGRCRTSR